MKTVFVSFKRRYMNIQLDEVNYWLDEAKLSSPLNGDT